MIDGVVGLVGVWFWMWLLLFVVCGGCGGEMAAGFSVELFATDPGDLVPSCQNHGIAQSSHTVCRLLRVSNSPSLVEIESLALFEDWTMYRWGLRGFTWDRESLVQAPRIRWAVITFGSKLKTKNSSGSSPLFLIGDSYLSAQRYTILYLLPILLFKSPNPLIIELQYRPRVIK